MKNLIKKALIDSTKRSQVALNLAAASALGVAMMPWNH